MGRIYLRLHSVPANTECLPHFFFFFFLFKVSSYPFISYSDTSFKQKLTCFTFAPGFHSVSPWNICCCLFSVIQSD